MKILKQPKKAILIKSTNQGGLYITFSCERKQKQNNPICISVIFTKYHPDLK